MFVTAPDAGALITNSVGTALFYPRILIERTGTPSVGIEPTLFCEYADGSSGPGGLTTLTKQPKATIPAFEPVKVNRWVGRLWPGGCRRRE